MFTVLVPPIRPDPSVFSRFRRRARIPLPTEIHCQSAGLSYYLIEVKQYHKPDTLQSVLWELPSQGLVISPDLELPEEIACRQIPGQPFQERLTENTLRWLLERSHPSPYLQQLGIIDEDASCLEIAERFVRICPSVRIFTRKRESYQKFLQRMMEEYGAPVLLAESLESLSLCSVIYCPRDFQWTEKEVQLEAPVICAGSCQIAGQAMVIHSLEPLLPDSFINEVPASLPPSLFAQAVFWESPESFLSGCRACQGVCGNHHPTMEDIVRYIRLNVEKNRQKAFPSAVPLK